MAARKRQPIDRVTEGAQASSWMAILASTTLGLDTAAKTLQATVRLARPELESGREYRLVVQSYDGAPGAGNRPVGSVQRAVSAEELRAGVTIDLLELRPAGFEVAERPTVVAWVETGKPDLEYDGRMARPRPGSVYGSVRRRGDANVAIALDKTLAA
jgi:hypothetical protein